LASLSKDGPKKYRILFTGANGKRQQIRFSGFTPKDAKTLLNVVERLISAKAFGSGIDPHDVKILASLPDRIHQRLAKHGLVETRVPEAEPERVMTLATFLQQHNDDGRTSKGKKAARNTVLNWSSTRKFLVEVLGADRDIATISLEDAHQFRRWMDRRKINQKTAGRIGQPMSENAKRKHIANCKTFFNAAKRRGLITLNPFDSQVSSTEVNRSRDYFVTPADTRKILDAAPDSQWRLLIALWRLAGLRKMEVFELTWGDVLWDQGKLRVRSSKTEHIEGCEMRYVPIRDVRGYLDAAFTEAEEGTQSVITRFSATNDNLDKPFRKIIESAGMEPWPKLFQNLRSSCETQWLKDGERADLVANWIGHSVKVQNKNYVQHTEEDIDAFNNREAFTVDSKATQKATQNATENGGSGQHTKTKATHSSN